MNPPPADPSSSDNLAQLLRRQDVWRGHAQRLVPQLALATGFDALDSALLNRGWPLGSLIEVCQEGHNQGDWCLLSRALTATKGLIILLNPPELPFAQGLIQLGIDLERVLIVQTPQRADFLNSFVELSRSNACDAVLAWQPKQALTYTDLRKCLLASAEAKGLFVLFRPASAQQQSSPACLRLVLDMQAAELRVTIFKQKGMLQQRDQLIPLAVPDAWQAQLPHGVLGREQKPQTPKKPKLGAAAKASGTLPGGF